jgi:hypothetical protein
MGCFYAEKAETYERWFRVKRAFGIPLNEKEKEDIKYIQEWLETPGVDREKQERLLRLVDEMVKEEEGKQT